jgi:hypothetical protein
MLSEGAGGFFVGWWPDTFATSMPSAHDAKQQMRMATKRICAPARGAVPIDAVRNKRPLAASRREDAFASGAIDR